MEELSLILERHGVWLLFAVGFLEYAGAPIASVPILVVAGALAAMGDFPIAAVVASVGVERKVRRVKPLFLIPAKFIPATGNLVACALVPTD